MTDYASPREVFAAVDGFASEVESRLRAVAGRAPLSRKLALSFLGDHERHRRQRAALLVRLGLAAAPPLPPAPAADASLDGLRTAQDALVLAHAEGLSALGDAKAVDVMAQHMVDHSRHLTLIDLWLEQEQPNG